MSIVTCRYGIQPNQLFTLRKLAIQGPDSNCGRGRCRSGIRISCLSDQIKELQRLLGKKTMRSEILKEALEIATGPDRVKQHPSKVRGRPPLADDDLVDEIKAIVSERPTYGYRRFDVVLRR